MELKPGSEFRGSLKSLLWVNILHDAPAKQIVEARLPNLWNSNKYLQQKGHIVKASEEYGLPGLLASWV